jgi:thioesterase domain-containing protein
MSNPNTMAESPDTGLFDPVAAFLDLKFRKKGPLVKLKKADQGIPVYFIHELTGTVSCYHQIVEVIEAPVFGIQVPQSERSGSSVSTIESLAAKYVDLIIKNQPEGPFHLVSWSAGVTTTLEVARQLTVIGRQPKILVNIDQHLDNAKGIVSSAHSFLENSYYWLCNEPKWPLPKFGRRLLEKFTETIRARTAPPSPNPASEVHKAQDLMNKVATPAEAEFIRKFYDLHFAYIPPRSYSGQVLTFVARGNPEPDKLIKSWKSIARNSQFIFIPGDHLGLVRGASVIELREHVRKAFSKLPATPATFAKA